MPLASARPTASSRAKTVKFAPASTSDDKPLAKKQRSTGSSDKAQSAAAADSGTTDDDYDFTYVLLVCGVRLFVKELRFEFRFTDADFEAATVQCICMMRLILLPRFSGCAAYWCQHWFVRLILICAYAGSEDRLCQCQSVVQDRYAEHAT